MYTMVLMMAASSAGDTADFGFRRGGGCTGAAVAPAAGCTGSMPVASASCTGAAVAPAAGCTGSVPVASAGCSGGGGGFLGIRAKLGGLFSGRGGSGCTGGAITPSAGCTGGAVAAPVASTGCTGGAVAAPVVAGCEPTMGTVGTPVANPAVVMPPVDPKPMPPKKDEPKKGTES